ncbi:MFS transporter [Pseudonocardia humida]|uniref:MFS transporter n=1 Tax=Pseudonocardia humida TaxID=2800819 RepID=A0ABT0ZSX6_9PSEU|nr:MFS transporter [Pseudonocardia humida]MCO1653828.1 MFS transporter [Pseudonocardia humida]
MVVGGSVLLTLQNGLIMSAFGAYLVAITADTGWAPGVIALGYAVLQLGNGFIAPLTGWACDRFGTRAVARTGNVVTAAGFALAGTTGQATHFVAAVVVIALGLSAAGIMPLTVAVVQALPRRRTLALGLLPTGIAVGGLAVPLVALALDAVGWRVTFFGVAAVILVVGQLAGAVLPTEGAAARVAASVASARTAAGSAAEPAVEPAARADHDLRGALRTSAFWLLVLGHGSALVAISAVNLHLVPLLTHDRGLSLAAAGVAMGVLSMAQLVGQVVTGLIGDRVDKRRLAAACMVVQTAVLVLLALAPDLPTLLAAAVVHGLTWGLRGPVMTSLRTDYFGLGSFGTIMGWSMGFVSVGLVVGPLLVSALEAGAGYPVAFGALAVVTGAGSLAFLVLREPRPVPRPVTCGQAG